ncbi:hypothetical protein HG530_008371 [Fusarium avenaceum]|nr:hypothetical protein HG530_008371 [Fusarium avenaceum]
MRLINHRRRPWSFYSLRVCRKSHGGCVICVQAHEDTSASLRRIQDICTSVARLKVPFWVFTIEASTPASEAEVEVWLVRGKGKYFFVTTAGLIMCPFGRYNNSVAALLKGYVVAEGVGGVELVFGSAEVTNGLLSIFARELDIAGVIGETPAPTQFSPGTGHPPPMHPIDPPPPPPPPSTGVHPKRQRVPQPDLQIGPGGPAVTMMPGAIPGGGPISSSTPPVPVGKGPGFNRAHVVPLASLPSRNSPIVSVSKSCTAIVLDNVVSLAISREVRKPNLTARLANASRHSNTLLPNTTAVDRWDILVILPILNSSTIVKDKEVRIAITIEICKSDLAARLANARRNDNTILPDASVTRIWEIPQVQIRFDGTAAIDDQIVSTLVSIHIDKLNADAKVLPHTNASIVSNGKEVGETISVHIRKANHVTRDTGSTGGNGAKVFPIAVTLAYGVTESLDGPAIIDNQIVYKLIISQTVIVHIGKTDHISLNRFPVWVDLSDTGPLVRLASINPSSQRAIAVSQDVVCNAVAIEIRKNQLFAATILNGSTYGTHRFPCAKSFENSALFLPDLTFDLLPSTAATSADAQTYAWCSFSIPGDWILEPTSIVGF